MIDWQAIIVAALPTVTALATLYQTRVTHKAVNSRMDTLLKIATERATAEATLAEQGAEHGRKVARAKARKPK